MEGRKKIKKEEEEEERERKREIERAKRRKKKLQILFCAGSDFDHVIHFAIELRDREEKEKELVDHTKHITR